MSAPLDVLRAVWQQVAHRNDWQLARDEHAFLQCASAEYDMLAETTAVEARARSAVMRAYSILLYEGFQQRHGRAVEEWWVACYRLSRRMGYTSEQAQLIAQETVARLLANLHHLRLPHSFIAWGLKIYRTVRTALTAQTSLEEPLQGDEEASLDSAAIISSPHDVEQTLVRQQIIASLREKVPNQLEYYVLLRVVLFGDHPRDIARDLRLPLYRTRVAKSRALQRLRADPVFVRWLTDLLE